MITDEHRAFIRNNRTAVFGYSRNADGPAMSLVYYVVDDDGTIVVSTMAHRAKARAAAREPRVSICVLDEQWPPSYVNVYCDAEIEEDLDTAADTMMRIGGVMAGNALDESVRPILVETARKEERVTLRLRPYAAFATPAKGA
jgi:PPOX class probable F420-dependent enzyme